MIIDIFTSLSRHTVRSQKFWPRNVCLLMYNLISCKDHGLFETLVRRRKILFYGLLSMLWNTTEPVKLYINNDWKTASFIPFRKLGSLLMLLSTLLNAFSMVFTFHHCRRVVMRVTFFGKLLNSSSQIKLNIVYNKDRATSYVFSLRPI